MSMKSLCWVFNVPAIDLGLAMDHTHLQFFCGWNWFSCRSWKNTGVAWNSLQQKTKKSSKQYCLWSTQDENWLWVSNGLEMVRNGQKWSEVIRKSCKLTGDSLTDSDMLGWRLTVFMQRTRTVQRFPVLDVDKYKLKLCSSIIFIYCRLVEVSGMQNWKMSVETELTARH